MFEHLEELVKLKNADYGDAYLKYGAILEVLFPDGLTLDPILYNSFGLSTVMLEKMIRASSILFIKKLMNFESVEDSLDDLSVTSQLLANHLRDLHNA